MGARQQDAKRLWGVAEPRAVCWLARRSMQGLSCLMTCKGEDVRLWSSQAMATGANPSAVPTCGGGHPHVRQCTTLPSLSPLHCLEAPAVLHIQTIIAHK